MNDAALGGTQSTFISHIGQVITLPARGARCDRLDCEIAGFSNLAARVKIETGLVHYYCAKREAAAGADGVATWKRNKPLASWQRQETTSLLMRWECIFAPSEYTRLFLPENRYSIYII